MVGFKNKPILFLASILFILACAGSSYAEDLQNLESSSNVIYVNSSGHDSNNGTSWQWAKQTIGNATGTVANGGTVNIANGDYKDSKDIKIVINKNITIAGQSELNTVIDAGGNGYIFSIKEGCTVILKNLTLKNGKSDNGGAINNQGNLTIESCSLNNNHVDIDSNVGYGGAIYNSGSLNITECEIYSNHAANGDSSHHDGRDGGAIYNTGTLIIANSNINKNHAGNGNSPGTGTDIGRGGNGGSIFNTNTGNLTITNCSFSNNTAGTGGDATPHKDANAKDGGSGGGIYSNGNLTITICTFTENSAGDGGDNPGTPSNWGASGGNGGAIYINQGTANITESSFNDNNAGNGHHGGYGGYGGGIYNNGVLTLQSSEMTKNDAGNGGASKDSKPARQGGFGGAIFNNNTLNILYCTFQTNHAGDGGNSGDNPGGDGGLGGAIFNNLTLNITNSKFLANSAGVGADASGSNDGGNGGHGGSIYNNGTLTVQNNTSFNGNFAGNGGAGGGGGVNGGGNGGHGGTIFNSANTTSIISNAYFENNFAGTGSKGGNAGSGGIIYTEGFLELEDCQILNNYAGNGGNATPEHDATDGGYGGAIYSKYIANITNCNFEDNFAGKGGDSSGIKPAGDGGNGGAIYTIGILTITNCNITRSLSGKGGDVDQLIDVMNAGNGGNGGAICNFLVNNVINNLTIVNCNFSHCKAERGGYGYLGAAGGNGGNGGAIYTTGTLSITQSTFDDNKAGHGAFALDIKGGAPGNGGSGGAIYDSGKIILLQSCNFINNAAGHGGDGFLNAPGDGGNGGAIYNTVNLTMENCTFTNNTAGRGGMAVSDKGGPGGSGGAIYNSANLTLENCTFTTNSAGHGGLSDGDNGGNGGNGGAIYNSLNLNIENCTFTGNTAGRGGLSDGDNGGNGGSGGAIYNKGTLNISLTELTQNEAGKGGLAKKEGDGGNGGAIDNEGALTITESNLEKNKAGGSLFGTKGLGMAIYSNSNHNLIVNFCRIYDHKPLAIYLAQATNTTVNLQNNWWGSNSEPIDNVNGTPNINYTKFYTPWLVMGLNATNSSIYQTMSTNIAANLIMNSAGENTLNTYYKWIKDGITISFHSLRGSVKPKDSGTVSGTANAQFTADDGWGPAIVFAGLDDQTLNTTVEVGRAADIEVVKTVNNQRPSVGDTVTFTITVKNKGPSDATDIQITDIMPNGFTNVIKGIPDGTSYIKGVWTIPTLSKGSKTVLTLTGTVTEALAGLTTTNYANKTNEAEFDPNPSNDNSSASIHVTLSNITMNKTVDTNIANVGDTVTFTVSVTNNGPDDATNVQINDIMPAGFTNLKVKASTGSYSDGVWKITKLENGKTATLKMTGTVTGDLAGKTTTNNATLNYNPSISANASIYVPLANVQITKTTDKNTPNVGDTATFTITATNNGPDQATNIKITDSMPYGFNNIQFIASAGTSYLNGIWTIPQLSNGSMVTLTLSGIVNSTLAGKNTTNNANKTHQDQYDSNPADDTASASIYVPLADTYVAKTVNKNNPKVGETVVFTVLVINDGPDNATNININDFMPDANKFDNVQIIASIGTYNITTGIWTIPFLASGANATLNLSGVVTPLIAGDVVTNTANKTYQDQYDPSPDNTASASINVLEADIILTKTADKEIANVGESVIFTIIATNNGPDNATGLIFLDKLPIGLSFASASATNGTITHEGNYILWDLGNLTYGGHETLTINITVISPGNQTNIVRKIHENQYDPNIDFATATIYVPQANVQITKTVNNSTLNVGDTATFTITATNNGQDNATNIKISDLMPNGLNNIQFSTSPGTTYSFSDGIWTIPQLNNGDTVTLNLTGIVNSTLASKNTTNIATRTQQDQYNPLPTTANATIYVPLANVQINKTTNKNTPNVGETVTFTITATNNGPDQATNIKITDIMPAGFEGIIAIPSTGSYAGGVWSIPVLENGANAVLTLSAIIGSSLANQTTTNTATRTQQDQYNSLTATANANIYVPLANVQINKTTNKNTPNVGETVTFTITATNNGPDNATNIKIADLMPYGFNNLQIIPSVGTSYSNGVWSIPLLVNGISATLTLSGIVNSTMAGKTTTNTANKTQQDQYDSNPADDAASASIYVPLADTHVAKTVNKNTPTVGDIVTFTVTVINDGPDNATNIKIYDIMPDGFSNVIITPSTGTYNITTGIWTIPFLANGTNATLNLSGNVTAYIASEIVTNTATETHQDQYDPTPDNTASASINVREADIELTKAADKNIANVGENVIFTINATNNGPDNATGLLFIDKLPLGLSYISATATIGTVNQAVNYVLWTIENLENTQIATLIINTTVNAPGNQTNIVRKIHQDQYDPNIDFANATIYVPQANVQITKTVNNSTLNVGDTATFTITATNNGPDQATNIKITDIMPQGFNNIQITASPGTTYSLADGIWTIPQLNNGNTVTLNLTGIVNSTIASKNTTNTATRTQQDQYNPLTNTANATIYVPLADVYIGKTVDNNNPKVGDIVTFTVTVINDGPDNATNITIIDIMPGVPGDFSDISINPSMGTYNSTTGIWTIPFLANGANATLNLSGNVTANIVGVTVTNTATETHQDQYDPIPDNTASASIYVKEADIILNKSVNKITANVGDILTFTITATNNGPDPATGLIFIDKLPIGLQYLNSSATIGTVTTGTNYILWTIGNLDKQQTATLTLNTTVTSTGFLKNIVRKIHEDQYDPNIDFATAIVYVLEADVNITNIPNESKLNVGDIATFTVTARNNGPNTATNVVINDIIPPGFTAQVNKGKIINGMWNIGNLERNEEAILTLSGIITSDWAGKSIYNIASETQDEYNTFPQTVSSSIYVPLANVTITKVARDIHFDLNDTVRFLVMLDNHGLDEATGIKVIDQLPDDLEFVSASEGGLFDSISRTITWNIDSLASGASHVLLLTTKVKTNISNNFITNTATESQNEYNQELTTANTTITINKADLYLTSTSNNLNPSTGEPFTITFKLGNRGPDTAKNVLIQIPIPEGLEFVSVYADNGTCYYNSTTSTVIWNLGDVAVGDPYLYLTLRANVPGEYTLYPLATTTTFDPNLENSIIPFSIYIKNSENGNGNTVNAASETVGMQKTGGPIPLMVLAILLILGGILIPKRK